MQVRLSHLRRAGRAPGYRRRSSPRAATKKAGSNFCLGEFRRLRFPELPTLDEFLEQEPRRLDASRHASPPSPSPTSAATPRRIRSLRPPARSRFSQSSSLTCQQPDEIPAIPKYIQEWESPFSRSDRRLYPLQAIGHHTLHRVHSTHDNNDWLEEAFPQRVFINPLDAASARHPGWRPRQSLQ